MKILKKQRAAFLLIGAACILLGSSKGYSQESRADSIAARQEEKSKRLEPEQPDKVEQIITKMIDSGWVISPNPRGIYPYFDSVYSGGGFTLGAGYRRYCGYSTFAELRGLYSFKNYKKIEFRTVSSDHAGGHVDFELLGGWMDATQIGYYGLGIGSDKDAHANFRIEETYARGGIKIKPVPWFQLKASTGYDRYLELDGTGSFPPVRETYNPTTAPGLRVSPSYIRTEASAGIVTAAPAEAYARRGGVYRYTFQDYRDISGDIDNFQFHRGEVIQHIPILRETWILSLRGRLESVTGSNALVPYYLLPWLGSGSTLRGYDTGRFHDRNGLLMSGELRWVPNRFFLDMALFYDVGTVAPRINDFDFDHLKHDYGLGFRVHGPEATAFRFDVAHGSEGWQLIFSASAPF